MEDVVVYLDWPEQGKDISWTIFRVGYLLSATMYYRPLDLLDLWKNQLKLTQVCVTSMDKTKTDYSNNKKNPLLPSSARGITLCNLKDICQRTNDSYSSCEREYSHGCCIYLREAAFLITLSRNRSLESNDWGTRVRIMVPHWLINYRPFWAFLSELLQ